MNMQVDRMMRMLGKHRNSPITAWIGFLALSLLVWKLVSDGDFSFIIVRCVLPASHTPAMPYHAMVSLSIHQSACALTVPPQPLSPPQIKQTYGAFARTFGFGLLAFKIWTARSATGVSFKTLQLYALVFFFRLTSIIPFSGYLPYDKCVHECVGVVDPSIDRASG